jgi:hypothetical protein
MKRIRALLYRIIPVAIAAAIAGCALSPEDQALRELPSFHVGYGDGCTTSNEEDKSFSTKFERDAYAFDNDQAYRAGWRQGYLECSNRTQDVSDGGLILGDRNEF